MEWETVGEGIVIEEQLSKLFSGFSKLVKESC